MNFPIDQPLFQFFDWIVNTPGIGSAAVGLLVATAVAAFTLTLRWIVAAKDSEPANYPFPPHS
ncbi:MAG: hypothetical protein Fur002_05870 [Anaerolineales bacterium]